MALSALRPTGDAIIHQRGPAPATLADGFETTWLASGTAALATAMLLAKHASNITVPEVILPAYGCPDLVAAASYAGVRAVLVDIQLQSPHFDYDQLRSAINANTVAIVAATLLGIRAEEKMLREIIGNRAITLIEDSAQWFPRDAHQTFFGDAVVVSFGRGKPVNLLGGGALLTRTALPPAVRERIGAAGDGSVASQLKYRARIAAYNTLIQPAAYGLAEKAPFLHIGATVFHALPRITSMPAPNHALLGSNLRLFRDRSLATISAWKSALNAVGNTDAIDLTSTHAIPDDHALLRYPVLIASDARRTQIYAALKAQGLGASIMYPQALFDIAGVRERAALFAGQENARRFSQQLLTLPTHGAVTQDTINSTVAIMQSRADAAPIPVTDR
jgi:dTDP-4-amino-4,6-dideoxygalactose transaminase